MEIVRVNREIFERNNAERETLQARVVELETELDSIDNHAECEKNVIRLEKQNDFLRREIRTKRLSAHLDVARDAIILMGITLQDLASAPSLSPEADDAKARTILALHTLGAETYGDIGDVVEYDPGLHKVENPPHIGTRVCITAPGIQFFRNVESPFPVLKAPAEIV